MVFSSNEFLFLFIPCFFILYFALPSLKWKNILLLFASLVFYAWGEHIYIFLMLLSIVGNYLFAHIIVKSEKPRLWLIFAVTLNLLLIGIFKYTGFFVDSLNSLLNININLPRIELPLGISFFTLQCVSYIGDVYTKKISPQKNILYLGAYVSAFPQLVAGPIVRYSSIENELVSRSSDISNISKGIRRFIQGFAKKVIIANSAALICDNIFTFPIETWGALGAWTAVITYTLQIYYDFSGYSDMAIGLGLILGFRFPENFDYPYIARSITEFWRRWHISLSSFFRDYVYIPLGGNRVKAPRFFFNLFIVWFLTGLWHGASWNFIFWGLYYFILLIIEKQFLKKSSKPRFPLFGHLYTMLLVMWGWVIFRTETLAEAFKIYKAMFFLNGSGKINLLVDTQAFQGHLIIILIIGIICSAPVLPKILQIFNRSFSGRILRDTLILILFVLSIVFMLASSYNPFIYFRF